MRTRQFLSMMFVASAASLPLANAVDANTNPACGKVIRIDGQVFHSSTGGNNSCGIVETNSIHILGSPSGLAHGNGNGIFLEILRPQDLVPISGILELWAGGGQITENGILPPKIFDDRVRQVNFYTQALECSDPDVPVGQGTLPYAELTTGTAAVNSSGVRYFPEFGGAGTLSFHAKFHPSGVEESTLYGPFAGFPARSTDVDADGDTDEYDESLMNAAMSSQNLDYDLNWDGVVNGSDLSILLEEARRRDGNGEPYRRTYCIDNTEPLEDPPGTYVYTLPSTPTNMATTVRCDGTWKVQWTAGGDDGTSGTAFQYDIRTSLSPITLANFALADSVASPQPYASGYSQWILYPLGTATRYFAIRAKDNAGFWSQDIATVTAPGLTETVPPSTTTGMTATRGAGEGPGGQARIRWSAAGDDGNTGVAALYDLRVSDAPITSTNFEGGTPIEAPAPVAPGTLLTVYYQLDECTQYYFALKTIDDQGNCSGVSNSPTVTGYCTGGGLWADGDPIRSDIPRTLGLELESQGPEQIGFAVGVPADLSGAPARLAIYDLLGRKLATIRELPYQAGVQTTYWDTRTGSGDRVPIGVYAARLMLGQEVRAIKFAVIR